MKEIITGLLLACAILIFLGLVQSQPQGLQPVMSCYHHGEVIQSAPKVDDFRVQFNPRFIYATWTDSEGEHVLMTTLPCHYHVIKDNGVPAE